MVDIHLNSFAQIAAQNIGRVVVGEDRQSLTADSRLGFHRAIKNTAVRQAFSEAIKEQFGEHVALNLAGKIHSSKNLSSSQIRQLIGEAKELSKKNNMNHILAMFSQEMMKNPLRNVGAINVESIKSLASSLLEKPEYKDRELSVEDKTELARLLRNYAQNAGVKPKGVELLNQQRIEYNVEDRAKFNQIQEGDILGDFEFVRLKQKGVEPGFEARMAWKPEHTAGMQTAGTDLNVLARQYIDRFVNNEIEAGPSVGREYSLREFTDVQQKISAIKQQVSQGAVLTDNMREQIYSAALADQDIAHHVSGYVKRNAPYFTAIHYVKMDYAESDKTIAHKIRIPERTAKGKLHREFTQKTRLEANSSALKETLATDLMRSMGIVSQNARLIPAKYADGKLKLMVEAEHMSMIDQAGEKLSFKDFSGKIQDGILTSTDANGAKISDPVIENWGRNKILFLLMADRDAIGSRGDNKGRMGDTFAAIDPGHSLEGFMTFKNVHSDFSFDQPFTKNMRFKNFSMFDDCSFSEKMQGIRQILDMRENGADLKVFDSYGTWLNEQIQNSADSEEKAEFKKLASDVEKMRSRFIARRDYILDEVFGERIQFINANPPILDSLDALEKLTSETRMTSENGEIALRHPQLAGSRQEWHIASDTAGGYVLTTEAGREPAGLREFFQNHGIDCPLQTAGGLVRIHVAAQNIQNFVQAMTERHVVEAKHGRV